MDKRKHPRTTINEVMLDRTSPRNRVVEPNGEHSRWAPCSAETSAGFNLYMQKGAYIRVDREATRKGSPTKNDDQPVEERKNSTISGRGGRCYTAKTGDLIITHILILILGILKEKEHKH